MRFDRKIRESESIVHDLPDLLSGKVHALLVKNYFNEALAARAAQVFLRSRRVEKYTHEIVKDGRVHEEYLGVDRIGIPFNSTYHDPSGERRREYYAQAPKHSAYIRRVFSPGLSPIAQIESDLNQSHGHGAEVARFHGRDMSAGVVRVTNAVKSRLTCAPEPAHFDALPTNIARFDRQLAANIYLKTPRVGGELELWDCQEFAPLSSIEPNFRAAHPKPREISVNSGDLLLFNCRIPHAVKRFEGEARVSAQVFIGYREGESLKLWN